jgi:hypothetical protein
MAATVLLAATDEAIGGWLQRLSPMAEWNGHLILLSHIKVQEWMVHPGRAARETQKFCSLPGQDLSCLPGYWLPFSHMASG